MSAFRVGTTVQINVYEGSRPVFQAHTPEEAARLVALLNAGVDAERMEKLNHELLEALKTALGVLDHAPLSYPYNDQSHDARAKGYAAIAIAEARP